MSFLDSGIGFMGFIILVLIVWEIIQFFGGNEKHVRATKDVIKDRAEGHKYGKIVAKTVTAVPDLVFDVKDKVAEAEKGVAHNASELAKLTEELKEHIQKDDSVKALDTLQKIKAKIELSKDTSEALANEIVKKLNELKEQPETQNRNQAIVMLSNAYKAIVSNESYLKKLLQKEVALEHLVHNDINHPNIGELIDSMVKIESLHVQEVQGAQKLLNNF